PGSPAARRLPPAPPASRGSLACGVEREIQLKHVHPRLTKDAKLTAFRVLRNESAHLVVGDIAGLRYTRGLVFGGRGRNMRIEAGSRSGREIDRHSLRRIAARIAQRLDTAFDRFLERGVGGPLVGTGGRSAVVGLRRSARCAAPEVFRIGERL